MQDPKIAIYATSHNFVGLYLCNEGMYRQSERNLLNSNTSSRCPHNMANFGPLTAEIGWRVWGTQQISTGFACGFVTAVTSFTGGQPNFARCLAVSWAGILHIYVFLGLLSPDWTLPGTILTLHPSLAFSYIGSITAQHSTSGRQPNFVAWYKEWNYRTFADGTTYVRLGVHCVGHWPTAT